MKIILRRDPSANKINHGWTSRTGHKFRYEKSVIQRLRQILQETLNPQEKTWT